MKALLIHLGFLLSMSSMLSAQDAMIVAYWEKFWERDYEHMLDVARAFPPESLEEYSRSLLANAYVLTGKPDSAAHHIAKGDLLQSEDDNAWLMAAYAQTLLLQDEGNTAAQRAHEGQTEEELKKRKPGIRELYLFINTLSRSYYERGDPLGALRQLDIIRSHPNFADNERVRGRTQEKTAIVSWSVGQYDRARVAMEEAIAIHKKLTPEPDFYLAQLTNNLGVICNAQGDLAKAVQLYEIAREYYLAFEGQDSHWVNVSYSNIGKAHWEQGNLDDAEAAFRTREEILLNHNGTPFQRFENAQSMAVVLFEKGQTAAADSCIDRMESILQKHFPEKGYRYADLLNLKAKITRFLGNPEGSILLASESLVILESLGLSKTPLHSKNHLVLSKAFEGLGASDSAFVHAVKSVDPFLTDPFNTLTVREDKDCFAPLIRIATLLSEQNEVEQAEAHFNKVFETLDAVRLNLNDPASRRFVYKEALKVYFEYLDHLKRHANRNDPLPSQIFHTIERAKAFNLRLAQGQRKLRQSSSIPDSLRLQENTLQQNMSRLNEKASSLEDYVELDAIRQSLDSLRTLLRANYPEVYESGELLEAPTVDQVQRKLREGEAYITLLFGEKGQEAAVVTQDQVATYSFGDANLAQKISSYIEALRNPEEWLAGTRGLKEFEALGYEIYMECFADIKMDRFEHVIFSPSGIFGQLNLGLLITSIGASDYASIKWLMTDLAVSTQWTFTEGESKKPFASEIGLFAMSPDGENAIDGALEEVQSIVEASSGYAYLNDDCSETNFRNFHKQYGVLHLATHGFVDDQPWGTFLQFTPDSLSDGQLNLIEIAGLDLNVQHVTLSACKSAQSRWQTGEAFGSLAIGFAEAGCPSLTASLWDVPDQATREIMEVYYAGLSAGLPKSKALRKAQLDYLKNQKDPLKTHPFFWGGFIQIGDDGPLDFGRTRLSPWWWLLLLPLAVYGIQKFRGRSRMKAA